MSLAPPIVRDGFYYNGDLCVEVGNLNRHKRASISEITAILRPDLKKPRATSAVSPSKDPVGHWYEAQLIHYGLPPTKDKARAKLRLLEALNTSSLAVPAWIVRLEAQLKKEYAAAEKKAKTQYRADIAASGQSEPVTPSKKRKHVEATNSVNVNINFGPYTASSGGQQWQTASHPSTAMSNFPSPIESPASKKHEASTRIEKFANGTPLGIGTADNKDLFITTPTRVRPRETARSPTILQTERTPKTEHVMKKESSIKKEWKVKKEPSSSPKPKLGLINGYYEISCPKLQGSFSDTDDEFSLILCLDSPGVWGAYDFDMFSGILHLEERPWEPSHEPISCTWRGRENGENEISFGESCIGGITFLGDGRIEGCLNLYGECKFFGTRMPGPPSAPRSAASMKEEWSGYNEDAYEDEAYSRWGRRRFR